MPWWRTCKFFRITTVQCCPPTGPTFPAVKGPGSLWLAPSIHRLRRFCWTIRSRRWIFRWLSMSSGRPFRTFCFRKGGRLSWQRITCSTQHPRSTSSSWTAVGFWLRVRRIRWLPFGRSWIALGIQKTPKLFRALRTVRPRPNIAGTCCGWSPAPDTFSRTAEIPVIPHRFRAGSVAVAGSTLSPFTCRMIFRSWPTRWSSTKWPIRFYPVRNFCAPPTSTSAVLLRWSHDSAPGPALPPTTLIRTSARPPCLSKHPHSPSSGRKLHPDTWPDACPCSQSRIIRPETLSHSNWKINKSLIPQVISAFYRITLIGVI